MNAGRLMTGRCGHRALAMHATGAPKGVPTPVRVDVCADDWGGNVAVVVVDGHGPVHKRLHLGSEPSVDARIMSALISATVELRHLRCRVVITTTSARVAAIAMRKSRPKRGRLARDLWAALRELHEVEVVEETSPARANEHEVRRCALGRKPESDR